MTPRRLVRVPVVQYCLPGQHRGPWEEFRKLTEEDEALIELEKDRQRQRLMAYAGMDPAAWDAARMILGFEKRLQFSGPMTHERCAWCGAERLLRMVIKAFDTTPFFRPMTFMLTTTT